jgi:hypothetical protein
MKKDSSLGKSLLNRLSRVMGLALTPTGDPGQPIPILMWYGHGRQIISLPGKGVVVS